MLQDLIIACERYGVRVNKKKTKSVITGENGERADITFESKDTKQVEI